MIKPERTEPSDAEQALLDRIANAHRRLRGAAMERHPAGMAAALSALLADERALQGEVGCSCDGGEAGECCHGVCSGMEFAPAEWSDAELTLEQALALPEHGIPCGCRCHALIDHARYVLARR